MSRDLLYCFPLADVLLCMDGRQGVCVCVLGESGRGGGEEDCDIFGIDQTL